MGGPRAYIIQDSSWGAPRNHMCGLAISHPVWTDTALSMGSRMDWLFEFPE